MLGNLFGRLTAAPDRGTQLFDRVSGLAREPHWYLQGQVPDTLDGRFAMLSTVAALLLARIEQEGEAGNRLAVTLTERFIEVMDSEHRQLGLGDPTLGKTVRKLVAALARRTELWRGAASGETPWEEATRESLYKKEIPGDVLQHSSRALADLWRKLGATPLDQLEQGTIAQ